MQSGSCSPPRKSRSLGRSDSSDYRSKKNQKKKVRSYSRERGQYRASSWQRTERRRHRSRSRNRNSVRRKSRSRSGEMNKIKRKKNQKKSLSDSDQDDGGNTDNRERKSSSTCSLSSVSSSSPARSRSPKGISFGGLALQECLNLKDENKKQKELMKAMETPEEKRARRLAKKEAKERKKRENMGWGKEYMGYTNTDNPFGDNNLLGTFTWSKALEKKGIGHLAEKDLKERNKRIQEDNRLELQKVKQLRLEREREKAMREQELEMLQREKEAEHFKTWEEQEDNFHLQQAKLRKDFIGTIHTYTYPPQDTLSCVTGSGPPEEKMVPTDRHISKTVTFKLT